MLKFRLFLCAICLAATSPLHASPIIEVGKLTKAQLTSAIKNASDDTIIERDGVKATKAQWRSQLQARHKPLDMAKLKEFQDERRTQFEAAKKALQDEQDGLAAANNAEVKAEVDKLKSP